MKHQKKSGLWAGIALLAVLGSTANSDAALLKFDITGPGVTAALAIDYVLNQNTGVLPSSPPSIPNTVDPLGSYTIKSVSGTFSDTTLGIVNASVDKILTLNPVTPEPGNTYAPASFSLFGILAGVPVGNGTTSPGLHYDNLFYPGGSPQTAMDYPFSGGLFDIYGLAFTLDIAGNTGTVVNLWSNGDVPGVGLNYGVAVANASELLDYTGGVSLSVVPLPASAPMFGAALLMLGAVGYGLRRKTVAAAI